MGILYFDYSWYGLLSIVNSSRGCLEFTIKGGRKAPL